MGKRQGLLFIAKHHWGRCSFTKWNVLCKQVVEFLLCGGIKEQNLNESIHSVSNSNLKLYLSPILGLHWVLVLAGGLKSKTVFWLGSGH